MLVPIVLHTEICINMFGIIYFVGTSFDEVTGLKQNPLANKNYEFMSLKPLWLDGFTRKYNLSQFCHIHT